MHRANRGLTLSGFSSGFMTWGRISKNFTEVYTDGICRVLTLRVAKHSVFMIPLEKGVHLNLHLFSVSPLFFQLSSLVSALVVLLILLFFAPFFYALQKCVLACIIIVSLRGALRKFKDVPGKWRDSKNDAIVWLVAMFATALTSVELGLIIGIVFSMSCIIFKTQKPKVSKKIDTGNCF